jgi:hypothetical protein
MHTWPMGANPWTLTSQTWFEAVQSVHAEWATPHAVSVIPTTHLPLLQQPPQMKTGPEHKPGPLAPLSTALLVPLLLVLPPPLEDAPAFSSPTCSVPEGPITFPLQPDQAIATQNRNVASRARARRQGVIFVLSP